MSALYPIRFADQVREHLRSLRKTRGLTQAQVGALIGVSQARIAEIEAKPGLVNFDQMLQLLSLLGAGLSLEVAGTSSAETDPATPESPKARAAKPAPGNARSKTSGSGTPLMPEHSVKLRKKRGSW
ncbi:helix-turn-helix domain-containing protein [Herbaspirillum sp. HC18]|nr:helix-turn-helix domain-containing protein [Herbaspirillum sp. HC18]